MAAFLLVTTEGKRMGRKFKVYLDSGANIHSRYEATVDLEDLGLESEEWDDMSDEERQEIMREVAWERMEWGFEEITEKD